MKFCDISSRNELADFLSISRKELTYILYIKRIENCYHTFEIPKKSGGVRTISAPSNKLKYIQRGLSIELYRYRQAIHKDNNIRLNVSHGFEKNKGILTNAAVHKNKKIVYNVDLKDFFESFHFGRVQGFFQKNKYFKLPYEVATVIAQLTCYNGHLPQGAPTSPVIANMICQIFDMRVLKLAKKYRLDYSRYADDMTFSTNDKHFIDNIESFYDELSNEISCAGFRINENKVRLQNHNSRQSVTGLVVNKKVNVNHDYYKQLRAMANSLYTKGEFFIGKERGTINQLEGMFSFIDNIDKYNNMNETNTPSLSKLNSRENQYQKFLVYKYFFANTKPVIITEGKTDIVYIKSALKKLYKEYPDLIEFVDGNKYEYKISFLKRSKRLKYFLKFDKDGADTITNLYRNFLSNSNNKGIYNKQYIKFFSENSKIGAQNPVILLFDNEASNNKKPLHKFITSIIPDKRDEFDKNLYVNLNNNIYLATNPLVNNKNESEIEDLFTDEVLSHIINGKKFSRESDYDTALYYGKEKFSNYIRENYLAIDFTGFRPLLDVIYNIIRSYDAEKSN